MAAFYGEEVRGGEEREQEGDTTVSDESGEDEGGGGESGEGGGSGHPQAKTLHSCLHPAASCSRSSSSAPRCARSSAYTSP